MYLYVAGDVEYFGSQHLPFAIIAIIVMIVFLILPTLLLFLYPCRCFQRILNRFHCNFHAVRVFMDVFQGPYKDGTNNSRDLRYFAGVFFLVRVIRESVDSLCRDGADTDTPIYQMKRLITPERYSYKPFQTYNKALRVFLYHIRPSKYVKCTDTMTYGNCHTSVFEYFSSSSSSSSSNGLPQN